jgi:hypothetical protein
MDDSLSKCDLFSSKVIIMLTGAVIAFLAIIGASVALLGSRHKE